MDFFFGVGVHIALDSFYLGLKTSSMIWRSCIRLMEVVLASCLLVRCSFFKVLFVKCFAILISKSFILLPQC